MDAVIAGGDAGPMLRRLALCGQPRTYADDIDFDPGAFGLSERGASHATFP